MLSELGIQAISFDLDDTLWPLEPAIVHAEQAYYCYLQEHCPALCEQYTVQQMRDQRVSYLREHPELRTDVTASRLRATRALLRLHGLDEEHADGAMAVLLVARNRVELYPDSADALAQLSFHYRLASLTNGNSDVQKTTIGHYFDCSLAATLALPAKPAPDMFAAACEQLGVAPERLLHIGDNPMTDIGGAQQFGCRTGWIRRVEQCWPAELPRADIEIENLSQLVAMAPPIPAR